MIVSCIHEGFSGGLGDFLRGSIYLCEYAYEHNLNFSINFRNHPIGKYIRSNHHTLEDNIIDLETYKQKNQPLWLKIAKKQTWYSALKESLLQIIEENKCEVNISSFYHDIISVKSTSMIEKLNEYKLKPRIAEFMQSNLIFSDQVIEYAQNYLINNRINSDYEIFHYRLGDINSWERKFKKVKIPDKHKDNINFRKYKHNFTRYLNLIKQSQQTNVILLSDNNSFKKYVKKSLSKNIYIPHLKSTHSALQPGLLIHNQDKLSRDNSDIFYIAVDMYLITQAKRINGFSVYDWGSGFPYWISLSYMKPITLFKIEAEHDQ